VNQFYQKVGVMDAQLYSLLKKKIINLLSFLSPLNKLNPIVESVNAEESGFKLKLEEIYNFFNSLELRRFLFSRIQSL
jgi:hypothetical protein